MVLQVVSIQVTKHGVQHVGEHRVILPNLDVGANKLLACLHCHFGEAFMLDKSGNYVEAILKHFSIVITLYTLELNNAVDFHVCCYIAHFSLFTSKHCKHLLDVLVFNDFDILFK